MKDSPRGVMGPTLALQMWGATAGRVPGAMEFFRPTGPQNDKGSCGASPAMLMGPRTTVAR
jgi:hypothetical protein